METSQYFKHLGIILESYSGDPEMQRFLEQFGHQYAKYSVGSEHQSHPSPIYVEEVRPDGTAITSFPENPEEKVHIALAHLIPLGSDQSLLRILFDELARLEQERTRSEYVDKKAPISLNAVDRFQAIVEFNERHKDLWRRPYVLRSGDRSRESIPIQVVGLLPHNLMCAYHRLETPGDTPMNIEDHRKLITERTDDTDLSETPLVISPTRIVDAENPRVTLYEAIYLRVSGMN
jgi:hypothetical protein